MFCVWCEPSMRFIPELQAHFNHFPLFYLALNYTQQIEVEQYIVTLGNHKICRCIPDVKDKTPDIELVFFLQESAYCTCKDTQKCQFRLHALCCIMTFCGCEITRELIHLFLFTTERERMCKHTNKAYASVCSQPFEIVTSPTTIV